MRKIVFCVVCLCFLSSTQGAILSLNEIQDEIVKSLPLIKQYEQKIKEEEAKLRSVRGAFDTKIKVSSQNRFDEIYKNNFSDIGVYQQTSILGVELFAGRRLGRGNYPVYDEKFQTSRLGEAYIGAILPLLRNILIDSPRYTRRSAQLRVNVEKEEYKLKTLELLNVASKKYWDWVLSYNISQVRMELLKLAESRQKIYLQKSQAGALEKIKLTDNLRLINKRQAEYNESLQKFTEDTLDINLYLNKKKLIDGSNFPSQWVYKNFLQKTKNIAPSEFKKNWPIFQRLDFEKEKLLLDQDFYSHQMWPLLNLKIEGVRDVGGGSPVDTHPDDLRLGIFFEYPLENNQAKGNLSRVRSQRIAFEAQYEWLDRVFKNQVNQTLSLLQQAEKLIDLRKREVENTTKMLEAEAVKFEKGASNFYILNLREEDEALAKINLHRAFHGYHQLIMDYDLLAGNWLSKLPQH